MKRPTLDRASQCVFDIRGVVGDYLRAVTDQWLLVAPKANPAMLEMFRDRDASPLRDMVPWAGEFAGKYLTGAVEVLRLTGDPRLKAGLREFVTVLVGLQAEDGYLGPWPKHSRLTNASGDRGGTWDTWGHYHIMLGLLLWHDETLDRKALQCATRIGELICRKYMGRKKPRLVETGSTEMNLAPAHSLCLLFRRTRNEKYLAMARQIVDEFPAKDAKGEFLAGNYLLGPLSGQEFFELPKPRWESLHPIMALAELYWLTGDEQCREAFERIWWSIVKLDRHNTGGFSSGEQANGNPYDLRAIETCCTIAWMAMSVEMLKISGDSVVADELELSLMNSVVGMHSPSGRWATYDTPMNGVRRASAHAIVFQAREGSPDLNCCSVNSSRGFGLLSEWAVMEHEGAVVLNWYGPSTITTRVEPGVALTLTQSTGYPYAGRIELTVSPSEPCEFTLKLRIPYWSERTGVTVNGEHTQAPRGDYLALGRKWRKGDRIQLDLDMSRHVWAGEKECKGRAALYRGPILLAYDHRYNLEHASGEQKVRSEADPQTGTVDAGLKPPVLDLAETESRPVQWDDWLPPALLLESTAGNGKKIRLCDYGSAGEGGTPYVSWLPVRNGPGVVAFSRENPLRSSRPGG